jgi:hypothetical protein
MRRDCGAAFCALARWLAETRLGTGGAGRRQVLDAVGRAERELNRGRSAVEREFGRIDWAVAPLRVRRPDRVRYTPI